MMLPRAEELRSIKAMPTHCAQENFTSYTNITMPSIQTGYHSRALQQLETPCTAEAHHGVRLHLESVFSAPSSLQRIIVT